MAGQLEMAHLLKQKRWWGGNYGNSKLIEVLALSHPFPSPEYLEMLGNSEGFICSSFSYLTIYYVAIGC